MKKTLAISFVLSCVCLVASAQDDGTTTNNWNSMPPLAPTAAGWDYALPPDWYFYLGMGFGFFAGMTGVVVKVFQTVTGAGDAGGE